MNADQVMIALTLKQAEILYPWLHQIAKMKPFAMSEQTSEILNEIAYMVEDVITNEHGEEE